MISRVSRFGVLLAGAAALMSSSAFAVPFTSTSVSTASPCPSFCGGPGGRFDRASDLGEEELFSFSELNNADGDGRAEATFAGVNLLPELRADAFSNSGFRSSRVTSTATSMQQYVYDGTGGPTTLSANIDGIIEGEGSIEASIVVIRAEGGADVPVSTDFGTLFFEIIPLTPGLSSLGSDRSTLRASGLFNLSVDFTVNATDSIFVWSQLAVSGVRGGSVDAFNTMTLALTGPAGFTPVLGDVPPTMVPEPGSLALLAIGLFGFAFARRKA